MNEKYKVAVWATGGVGSYAIRTIADRPNLDLVGVWVHSDSKNGKDAGELAGIDPLGVRATNDASKILDGDADCIVYAAPAPSRMKEAIGDLCRILAAGKNIVTTSISGLVYPRGSLPNKVIDAIRSAAETGRSSLFSSGIEPGFGADLFPVALMSMSHKVYSVRGIEITNYSEYPNPYDMRELFGFGQPLNYAGGLKAPGTLRWGWGAAVTMVGDALGIELDDIRETCEFQATPRDIDTAFGLVRAGTVGATRAACIGVVDGQDVVTIEHVDRLADDLDGVARVHLPPRVLVGGAQIALDHRAVLLDGAAAVSVDPNPESRQLVATAARAAGRAAPTCDRRQWSRRRSPGSRCGAPGRRCRRTNRAAAPRRRRPAPAAGSGTAAAILRREAAPAFRPSVAPRSASPC